MVKHPLSRCLALQEFVESDEENWCELCHKLEMLWERMIMKRARVQLSVSWPSPAYAPTHLDFGDDHGITYPHVLNP